MKHVFLTLVVLFIYATSNAQQNDLAFLSKSDVETTHSIKRRTAHNGNPYFRTVAIYGTSKIVTDLQQEVLNFNLKNNAVFDKSEKATYRIVFNKNQGKAVVIYNTDGTIIASKETYKNIKLPYELPVKISKTYPEWAFEKNTYTLNYRNNKNLKALYTIQIKKGNAKKLLKFNDRFQRID
ncbi:hypothetical protein [Flavivirga rizhaonensis]|uniref:Nicotinate-nucleotide adenylyltransferase n=1 Tax=Flavivirga rizhaonensis TaxID=2559571 RepID=A0A4V6R463_9FLAO|nr:hypothetical protein [Flavivirga rizhaonensis]TGV01494.1 hypothetical protein EM932_15485 [Flavivirga rizhaonensis]